MAPSFDTLSDHDFQEDDVEDEIDFSDLREQYDVRMEEGLDTFCVRSGEWALMCPTNGFNRSSMVYQLSTQSKNQS